MSEQWKIMGDCNQCRRQPYCKTQCSANKKFLIQMFKEQLRKKLEERRAADTAEKPVEP